MCALLSVLEMNADMLGSDGMIYAMPANAESVLQIDVTNQTTRLVGGPFVGENKWQNGAT